MAGWDTDEGSSVSATDRLRAALPGRRRRRRREAARDQEARQARNTSSLHEDRVRVALDYVGDYPEDENERIRCNQAFLAPPQQPLERAAG